MHSKVFFINNAQKTQDAELPQSMIQLKNDSFVLGYKVDTVMRALRQLFKKDFATYENFVDVCRIPYHPSALSAVLSEMPGLIKDSMDAITDQEIINVVRSAVDVDMVIHDPYMSITREMYPR